MYVHVDVSEKVRKECGGVYSLCRSYLHDKQMNYGNDFICSVMILSIIRWRLRDPCALHCYLGTACILFHMHN